MLRMAPGDALAMENANRGVLATPQRTPLINKETPGLSQRSFGLSKLSENEQNIIRGHPSKEAVLQKRPEAVEPKKATRPAMPAPRRPKARPPLAMFVDDGIMDSGGAPVVVPRYDPIDEEVERLGPLKLHQFEDDIDGEYVPPTLSGPRWPEPL